MKVYEVTITRPWDGRETYSIHITRKGALQVACIEGLDALIALDDDGISGDDLTWVEGSLETLINPEHRLTIEELDVIFNKCEELLWNIEMEIQVDEHTLQP